MSKNVLVVCGTRPEVIKLVPLIAEMRCRSDLSVSVCNTGQQRDLSRQAFGYFDVIPEIDLDIMRSDQTLFDVQSRLMVELGDVLKNRPIDAIVVQGDTISAFCGALAGFFARKPVFHVEAGLRSYNLSEPFPEEGLRQMLTRIATHHFAPTESNRTALLNEGVAASSISVTGNTVVDALSMLSPSALVAADRSLRAIGVDARESVVLVTIHRRENHGARLLQICAAIKKLAASFPARTFVLPVHPNPNVKKNISEALGGCENIVLTPSLEYPQLVLLMRNAVLIVSDSGGIQEEAPTFGVPILVTRYETERMEGVTAGVAELVGADTDVIFAAASKVLSQTGAAKNERHSLPNPYGDGHASARIADVLERIVE